MAQDFAKTRNTGKKASNKKPARAATRNVPQDTNHWSWFFSGLFSGVLLCAIGYFSLDQLNNGDIAIAESGGNESQEDEGSGNSTDLEFYKYLPQAEVEVNVVPVEVAANAGEGRDANVTYLLQAGSFQDPDDAEALRAKIILLNLETRIQSVPLSGRTWYRVQAGPFVGRSSMEAAENTLIQNNIDPIRLKIPAP